MSRLLRRIALVARGFADAADPRTFGRMLRLRLDRRLPARLQLSREQVELRLRALDGGPLYVRPRTSDLEMTLYDYVAGFHLPPPQIRDRDMRRIVELGCNAGVALAWYATRYPNARLLGVEPTPSNARQAELNTERFDSRCEIVNAGIWSEETDLVVSDGPAHSTRVRPAEAGDPPDRPRIKALAISDVFERYLQSDEQVDFVMISIEGCERLAFSGDNGWADRVSAIRLELNTRIGGPTRPEGEDMLRDLGFDRVWSATGIGGNTAYGIRTSPLSRTEV